jgi:uncharacterized membrane protein YgcG
MTSTISSAEDGTPDPGHELSQTTAPAADASDGLLVGMASPDRCTECGAEMALDQRYCVECGNRRGPARFALSRSSNVSAAVVPRSTSGNASRPPAIVLAATGIVIALLALGVGVLIGHDGKAKTVRVVVSGATASTSTGTGSTGGSTKSGSSSSSKSGGTSTSSSNKNFFGG